MPEQTSLKRGKKYLYCLGAAFALFFTNVLYNLMDCFLNNHSDFDLIFSEILPVCAVVTAAGTLLLSLILFLIPSGRQDRVLNVLLGLTAALTIASWAQITLLNKSLGLLDGAVMPDFSFTHRDSIIGTAVWLGAIALVFILRKVLKSSWRGVMAAVVGTVLLMEFGSLATSMLKTDKSAYSRSSYRFSFDEELTVSARGNVLLIIMDTVPNKYADEWLKEYPEEADFLNDFTYYDNANANYQPTYPAVLHLLTAHPNDVHAGIDDNCYQAWHDERTIRSYKALKDAGWKRFLYFPKHEAYVGGSDGPAMVMDFFDNVEDAMSATTIRYDRVWTELSNLALFRSAPQRCKLWFYDEANDVQTCVEVQSKSGKSATYQNYEMYHRLKDEGLKAADDSPYFVMQYLWGLHSPLQTGADCEYVEDSTQVTHMDTMRGLMTYLREYLRQLKEIGVYDNSTVIVMADHGTWSYQQGMVLIKEAGRTGDQLTVSSAPIDYSDMLNTVLINAGITPEEGTSIYDFAEGDQRTRMSYIRVTDENYPPAPKYHGTGDAIRNVYYGYEYTGDKNTLNKMAADKDITVIVPLPEAF